mmetsp:Transcript_30617/g.41466  ORF Transcript_30617/g.41466 Transcript_30617/m.41466 type:complete len:212 (+) Transcript_30617:1266-1901(+)
MCSEYFFEFFDVDFVHSFFPNHHITRIYQLPTPKMETINGIFFSLLVNRITVWLNFRKPFFGPVNQPVHKKTYFIRIPTVIFVELVTFLRPIVETRFWRRFRRFYPVVHPLLRSLQHAHGHPIHGSKLFRTYFDEPTFFIWNHMFPIEVAHSRIAFLGNFCTGFIFSKTAGQIVMRLEKANNVIKSLINFELIKRNAFSKDHIRKMGTMVS